MSDNKNDKIDNLLQLRQQGLYDFSKATKDLLEMGVKIASADGDISVPGAFEHYLDQYNNSNLEFEWEVEYKDGSKLAQFEGEEQHNFGHINLPEVKYVSFISNFDWPTDNEIKRVIIKLDMESGLFSIFNGFCPQEDLAKIAIDPVAGEKKLVLFARKRQSSSVGDVPEDIREFFPTIGESFYYNRFVLGFETPEGLFRAVIIDPNGNVSVFEK